MAAWHGAPRSGSNFLVTVNEKPEAVWFTIINGPISAGENAARSLQYVLTIWKYK